MPSCVLRISGRTFDPDIFLSKSRMKPDRTFHKGEDRPLGKKVKESGFTVLVSDAEGDNFEKQIDDAIIFLRKNKSELLKLKRYKSLDALMDFGVFERCSKNIYAWSHFIKNDFFKEIALYPIDVEISHYKKR
jgi:hypothetical protein